MTAPLPTIVDREQSIAELARVLSESETIPLDVESNGLHAYRPALCTLQLARVEHGEVLEVFVVDTLAIPDEALAPLRPILGEAGPPKILHDLAFDARILARHGVALGNVVDTAIAARFLGIAQTGLASLVEARVGVKLSKELQHHDWGRRPLDADVLPYLAADVAHLPALARSLFDDARNKDIEPEIDEETRYRLSTALADDEDDPRPAYVRIKGVQSLDGASRAVLRRIADVREEAARRWDLPPFKVVGNDVLLHLAKERPTDGAKLRSVRGLERGRASSLIGVLRRAIEEGIHDGDVPEQDRPWFVEPEKPPRIEIEARRGRENRLSSWRRRVAKERTVDEQVVLPGHCMQDLVARPPATIEEVRAVPGIGARRVERDGEAILAAIRGPAPTAAT